MQINTFNIFNTTPKEYDIYIIIHSILYELRK